MIWIFFIGFFSLIHCQDWVNDYDAPWVPSGSVFKMILDWSLGQAMQIDEEDIGVRSRVLDSLINEYGSGEHSKVFGYVKAADSSYSSYYVGR